MKALLCSVLLAALAMTAAAADLTGTWSGTFAHGTNESGVFMVLKQTGTQLTGTIGPSESEQWPVTKGKVEGNTLTGEAQKPEGPIFKITLILTGERLKGEVTGTPPGGPPLTAKLDAGRVK